MESRPDLRTITFNCAHSGVEFFVVFARYSSEEKFFIRETRSPSTQVPALDVVTPGQVSGTRMFDAKTFDFTGWHCACCGHKGSPIFVRCGKCERLICGATVASKNGRSIFRCAPDCGMEGEIEGEIAAFDTMGISREESARRTVEAPREKRLKE